MRVLVLYAHPVETSFCASLHGRIVETLNSAGHEVDDCDLYSEGFDPVLSRAERLDYEDPARNREGVGDHVERLLAADGLILVFPVWNFGFPAILKGYFDRVFLPGVSFRLEAGRPHPAVHRLRRIVGVATYGAPWQAAFFLGDPPRRMVRRILPTVAAPQARVDYLALYDMNRADEARRKAFLEAVGTAMERLR